MATKAPSPQPAATPIKPRPDKQHDSHQKPEIYVLQRNHQAAMRLNAQHDLWHKELQYNLHPSIALPPPPSSSSSTSSPPTFQIADVATGTAIWLLELASSTPHIAFTGLDINISQAPASAWLPPNVSVMKWDMMDSSGPPAGHEGKYDVVHVRLVILAIETDATPLIRNLLALLKPGGWLQWDEVNWDDRMLKHCQEDQGESPGPSITKISELMYQRSSVDWCSKMPQVLSEHGFEDVQRFAFHPRLDLLKYATDLTVMVWDEILDRLPSESDKKAIFAPLVAGMRSDAANGSGLAHGKLVTIARKPVT